VLIGKGAAWADASDALRSLVDRGIPYVCSPMSRGTLPDDHPNFMNSARSAALKSADVIVMVGGRFNWMFSFGSPARFLPEVKLVQIDLVAEEMYSGANLELGIVADADVACGQIAEALEGRRLASADGSWLQKLRAARDGNEASLRAAMESDAVPIDPHRLITEVRDAVPRNSSITIEGETTMGIARQILPCFEPRAMFNAGTTGCMGTGVPYAIGAKLARPDAPSVAVLGDYAFGCAAIDIETAMRIGAHVVFVVANNEGIVGHTLQDHMFPPGAPRIASLLPAHYEKMVEMVDGHSERVEKPSDIRPALDRALAADTVSLVHVLTDPKAQRLSGGVYMR
jgi:2-hydroxyacyl-CoA lyase 1